MDHEIQVRCDILYYLKDNPCVLGFNLTTITVAEKPNFTVNKGAHTWRSGLVVEHHTLN